MKKIITMILFLVTLNSQAFWNNNRNNNNNWGNNMPWNTFNYFIEDNGIFGFNPYEYTDPRWYPEEMSNMFDEFEYEFSNSCDGNNNNWNGGNWGNGYNNYSNIFNNPSSYPHNF